jgi:CMP/dCMP kinase
VKTPTSIAISGDPGGGKTTISTLLAETLGLRRISMGQLYRAMAQERGLTTVQMNLRSEQDESADDHIDRMLADLARSGEPLIVDGRLAWYFFPDAFKVHLTVDPAVAARRVMRRAQSDVETYGSIEEAAHNLRLRNNSERMRFRKRYAVDIACLRNYDMVCDTTHAEPGHVAESIIRAFTAARSEAGPRATRPAGATCSRYV